MAWTYSGDPSASNRDMVRFLIGDTDTSAQQLTDAEVDAMLVANGNSANQAAIACANALASKYARKVDKSMGDISISYGNMAKQYRELVVQLRRQAGTVLAPYAGGISVSDKQTDEEDTDRVQPHFKVGGMDYTTPVGSLTEEDA